MLVPDNIHPDRTIYVNGAHVLGAITHFKHNRIMDLYTSITNEHQMSIPVFVLCLDWLFLLGLVEMDSEGTVTLCS